MNNTTSARSVTRNDMVSTTINTLPNSPTLPFTINDDVSLFIGADEIDTTPVQTIIHTNTILTTIDTLPFMTNSDSPTLPSIIDDNVSLMIGADETGTSVEFAVRTDIGSTYIANPPTLSSTTNEENSLSIDNDEINNYVLNNMSEIGDISISNRTIHNSTRFQPNYYDIFSTTIDTFPSTFYNQQLLSID